MSRSQILSQIHQLAADVICIGDYSNLSMLGEKGLIPSPKGVPLFFKFYLQWEWGSKCYGGGVKTLACATLSINLSALW